MSKVVIGDSRVIESREVSDGVTIRRRREAPDGTRFTTYERIEKPNLAVIKKNGARQVPGAKFCVEIAVFLARWRHTGVNNLHFRVINVLCQPVGGNEKRSGHITLH